MLKTTLSTLTALLITATALHADSKSVSVSIDPETGAKKGVVVVAGNQNNAETIISQPMVGEPNVVTETIAPTPAQMIPTVTTNSRFNGTIIHASGAKSNYMVNEPIKIRLRLNKSAYIYFWTVSADGRGYLILPNNFESFNKYRPNMDYVVPERSADYDFVSDRAGVEQIYVLATNKQISPNKIQSIFSQRAGGVVPMATNKSIRKFITKDIQVIARNQNLQYDITSFQINVHQPMQQQTQQPIRQPNTTVNITVNP